MDAKTDQSPETAPQSILVAVCDLNGVARGKRLPASQGPKVLNGDIRMPLSLPTVDIWGRDIDGSPMIFESGDGDGLCRPCRSQILPAPWLGPRASYVPVWMFNEDGSPSTVDPRQALAAVLNRFEAQGLTPVVATELEFYLSPASAGHAPFPSEGVLSLQQLGTVGSLLDDIYAACALHDVPADAAISECGPGQFEINLTHRSDALLAADDAVIFKSIVRGFAQQHGFKASFMAKPLGNAAGSGLHVHFSLLDASGRNVFDDGSDAGSDVLLHAVAGVLEALPESTLIFAPHFNSYRRLRPNTHAPTAVTWGYENRTAAVRIPGGPAAARRIEHRVAGADANPYLVLAAVLGAALRGMNRQQTPQPPLHGDSYRAEAESLPLDWGAAIAAFEDGPTIADIFPDQMRSIFAMGKRQELARFQDEVTPFERQSYEDHV